MTETIVLPEPFTLVSLERADSTNEEAKRCVRDGSVHGTVVWARSQDAGKGRRGRSWVSEPGNLYCSIILKPNCSLAKAAELSFVMALSAASAIESFIRTDIAVQCKWPNDVLIDGHKVAGILLETVLSQQNEIEGLIAGVGINIAHHPKGTDFPATNIHEYGEQSVTVENVLENVCTGVSRWYDIWQTQGFEAIRLDWLNRAYGIEQDITVRLATENLKGTFVSLDAQGALILDCHGERRLISAGDVYFDESSLKQAS